MSAYLKHARTGRRRGFGWWTPERDTELRHLRSLGMFEREIASIMGTSRGSVGARSFRLGIPKPPVFTDLQRFERMYIPEPNSGCWLWLGTEVRGYGRFWVGGKLKMATHFALGLKGVLVPPNHTAEACHHCDNPACVNPDHLFCGSQSDNQQDCVRKGRRPPIPHPSPDQQARGLTHGSRTKPERVPRGERNGNARFTAKDIPGIRSDPRPCREIADEFGVTPQAIRAVKTRRVWAHIT